MKSVTAYLSLIVAGAVLLAGTIMLATCRLEYCGQPEVLRPHRNSVTSAATLAPTLAPPQKVVFVQVEADKSDLDLQVTWAEN
jgi:hypothetical protein